MKEAPITFSMAVLMVCMVCGCSRIDVPVEQQVELNESLRASGLQARYDGAGISGITLRTPVQSELSGESLETIIQLVAKWDWQNHLGVGSIGIQGPNSYVNVDLTAWRDKPRQR